MTGLPMPLRDVDVYLDALCDGESHEYLVARQQNPTLGYSDECDPMRMAALWTLLAMGREAACGSPRRHIIRDVAFRVAQHGLGIVGLSLAQVMDRLDEASEEWWAYKDCREVLWRKLPKGRR